jgi:hypothetical protein
MRANRSTWEILGSLLGLVILIVILNSAVGYYRQGSTDFAEQARVAGRPLTLTEVLTGDTGATEGITGTESLTGTAGITGTVDVTASTELTAATNLTTTLTNTAVVTVDSTTGVTSTAEVNETTPVTTPVTASSDLTATQTTTTTTDVTATTTVSETVAEDAAEESAPAITPSNAVTATDELTTTSDSSAATETATTADAEAPAELTAIFVKAGCIGCHVIPGVAGAVGMLGPNLTNIGVDGATRVEGLSSEEYIRQSLLEPNAVIAPECPTGPCLPNLMVQNLDEILTAEELDAVVAYLAVQGTTAP